MLTKEKILVVDDDSRNQRIIKRALSDKYELFMANSGQEALDFLAENKVAIVLLDIMMPGMNGYEVCSRIKEKEHLELTKVILVSGKAMTEERLEGYASGADDYLTKPFVREELEAKINVFIKLYLTETKLKNLNDKLEEEVEIRTYQLLQSERMAGIGKHTAEIVHNLRTPLTILLCSMNLIKNGDPKIVDKMEYAINRINNIAKSILDNANSSKTVVPESFNLNDVITEEVEFLKFDIFTKNNISIETKLDCLPEIKGHRIHFSQVLSNILNNAKEALLEKDDRKIKIKSYMENDKIIVEVFDSGRGIKDEDKKNVFNSLFTTKQLDDDNHTEKIVGTGLGLAFCKNMVESYGGSIYFDSVENDGTTFYIRMPINSDISDFAA